MIVLIADSVWMFMSARVIDFCLLGVLPKAIKYERVFSKFGELILMG